MRFNDEKFRRCHIFDTFLKNDYIPIEKLKSLEILNRHLGFEILSIDYEKKNQNKFAVAIFRLISSIF